MVENILTGDNAYFYEKMRPEDISGLKKLGTINELMEYVRDFGEKTAINERENGKARSLTYSRLYDEAQALGGYLAEKAGRGAGIALLGGTGYGWLKGFLGITVSGAKAVLLPPSMPPEAICGVLGGIGAKGIVYGKKFAGAASAVAEKLALGLSICFDTFSERANGAAAPTNPGDTAALLFTSGTTGQNKIVPLTQQNIMTNVFNGMLGVPGIRDARILAVLPLFHVFGFNRSVLTVLNQGGEIYFNENMKTLPQDLKWARPNILVMAPVMAEMLIKMIEKNGIDAVGGQLKTIIMGGAAMRPKLKELFLRHGIDLLQGFGMTECSMFAGNADNVNVDIFGSVGKLYGGNEAKTVDGELWVRGDGVFGGYLNPAENADAFCDGWFKTGDLAEISEDGYLFITGRKKFLIITENGENVSPEELELLVNDLPGVEESVAYQATLENGRQTVGIEVYSPAASEEQLKAMILEINRSLPLYKQMNVVKIRSEPFPKNPANKIIREGVGC